MFGISSAGGVRFGNTGDAIEPNEQHAGQLRDLALRLGVDSFRSLHERFTDQATERLASVVYVTGDVAGKVESPVYAILQLNEASDHLKLPERYGLERYVASQPVCAEKLPMK